jgi:predicted RNA-binding protein with PUA-like domain
LGWSAQFSGKKQSESDEKNDLVLFYHSNEGKEVVGVAKVVKESYQDPTTDDTNWVVVDLAPYHTFKNPVT